MKTFLGNEGMLVIYLFKVGMVVLVFALVIFFISGCRKMNPDLGVKLNPPCQLTTTVGDRQVELKWEPTTSTPEADYNIYQSVNRTKDYQKIASTKNTSYVVTNLVNGTTYYFKISASLNDVAESDPSNIVTVSIH